MRLESLSPQSLFNAIFVMWMDWHLVEKNYSEARTKLIGHLRSTAQAADRPTDIDDDSVNPFPGVMREGPMGVI